MSSVDGTGTDFQLQDLTLGEKEAQLLVQDNAVAEVNNTATPMETDICEMNGHENGKQESNVVNHSQFQEEIVKEFQNEVVEEPESRVSIDRTDADTKSTADSDDVPLGQLLQMKQQEAEDSSDNDDDVPLGEILKKKQEQGKQSSKQSSQKKGAKATPQSTKKGVELSSSSEESSSDDSSDSSGFESGSEAGSGKRKRGATRSSARVQQKKEGRKRSREAKKSAQKKNAQKEQKWTTLEHNGVIFPELYKPHGVKMLYDGKPVDLTPEQEEVATMYASMLETDYIQKEEYKVVFNKNFWEDFSALLGRKHVIQSLDLCDFTPIFEHLAKLKEEKKNLTKEEKQRIKQEKEALEAKYKVAYVDGREEQVGNFRVEPPGLFRGRGMHPKMGKLKARIYPEDITLNLGSEASIPPPPEGRAWKEVRHDNTVTWLAFWKDPISQKDFKYVFLGANSQFKTDSDREKYEKARRLKSFIGPIRENYTKQLYSKDVRTKQMATALYFIDRLALRAGHEKEEDEADTVGCCTLKVENVFCLPEDGSGKFRINFDFLGKDSIRYTNEVEVDKAVFENVKQFRELDANGTYKQGSDQLFDTFDATDLNNQLKELMDGLSVKVFRTYNASILLDQMLRERNFNEMETSVNDRKVQYDECNREVAILCNHQRSVPKTHEASMERIGSRLAKLNEELEDLQAELKLARRGEKMDGKKKCRRPEAVEISIQKKMEQIRNTEVNRSQRDANKTIALGTSKINYLDPRITVAWCKRNSVPINKLFTKTLLQKFAWAMDVDPDFAF